MISGSRHVVEPLHEQGDPQCLNLTDERWP